MSHLVTKTNTKSAVAFVLKQNGKPIALSGLTVKVLGKTDSYAAWITEGTTGVSQEPTSTFTAASNGLVTAVNHRVQEGDQIIVSSTGTLPTGLSASTPYFAVGVTDNAFGLASVPGGQSVITAAGSGTHSFYRKGEVVYDWQSADLASTGSYRLYFNVYDGSEYDTFPTASNGTHNPGFRIYIVEAA